MYRIICINLLCDGATVDAGRFYRATTCNATRSIAKTFLSVCPSDRRVHCDKMKETYAHVFMPYKKRLCFEFFFTYNVEL